MYMCAYTLMNSHCTIRLAYTTIAVRRGENIIFARLVNIHLSNAAPSPFRHPRQTLPNLKPIGKIRHERPPHVCLFHPSGKINETNFSYARTQGPGEKARPAPSFRLLQMWNRLHPSALSLPPLIPTCWTPCAASGTNRRNPAEK